MLEGRMARPNRAILFCEPICRPATPMAKSYTYDSVYMR
jgi:hypothetical protein